MVMHSIMKGPKGHRVGSGVQRPRKRPRKPQKPQKRMSAPTTKALTLKEYRARCLEKIEKDPHVDEFYPVGGQKAVHAVVRYRLLVLYGINLDKEEVVLLSCQTPLGPVKAYTIACVVQAWEKYYYKLCKYCVAFTNVEVEKGVAVKVFCKSCRMIMSEQAKCQEPECEQHPWVNELGIPSPVCHECHARKHEK